MVKPRKVKVSKNKVLSRTLPVLLTAEDVNYLEDRYSGLAYFGLLHIMRMAKFYEENFFIKELQSACITSNDLRDVRDFAKQGINKLITKPTRAFTTIYIQMLTLSILSKLTDNGMNNNDNKNNFLSVSLSKEGLDKQKDDRQKHLQSKLNMLSPGAVMYLCEKIVISLKNKSIFENMTNTLDNLYMNERNEHIDKMEELKGDDDGMDDINIM